MSVLKAPIDCRYLEEELHAALIADELYKLQNDAKIRAIEQAVPTYEHFRQMVNGAHLKPLDRDDTKPKIGVQWNPLIKPYNLILPIVSGRSTYNERNDKSSSERSRETCEDFLQSWRTIVDCSEKFTHLWNRRCDLRHRIFRIEIPVSFLGDFANTCLQHLSKINDVTSVVELIGILSTCNRFDLTICFMTRDEKLTCERLFRRLLSEENSSVESLETTRLLAVKYGIILD